MYSVLSLAFPAKETFVPEAITSEDIDENVESEKSSHVEKKGVDEDIQVV